MVTNERFGVLGASPTPTGDEGAKDAPVSGIITFPLRRDTQAPPKPYREASSGVELRFALFRAPCKVLRLSPVSVVFAPQPGEDYPHGTPLEVSLRGRGHSIHHLRGVIKADGEALRLTFLNPARESVQQIVGLLRDLARLDEASRQTSKVEEKIIERARIVAILKALGSVGARGSLRVHSGELSLRIAKLTDDGKVIWRGRSDWGGGPFRIEMIGYNSVYRLYVPQVWVEDGHAVTPLPTHVERIRQRRYRRTTVQSGLSVTFRHPIWPQLPKLQREVRDVSFGGMSFVTEIDDDLLYPGLVLHKLEMRDAKGRAVRVRGEVRTVSSPRPDESMVGVKVTPYSPADEQAWNRLVADTLYPTTGSGAEWSEQVWDLFRLSGYFNLSGKEPDHFDRLKTCFVEVGRKSESVPGLLCHAVYPSARGVEATLSMNKVYSGTWWGHQLAKQPDVDPTVADSREILRDIYLRAMEHPQADPTFRWMTGLIDMSVSWMRRSHIEFALRYQPMELSLARSFRLMEASCADRGLAARAFSISPAGPTDLIRLCDVVARTRPVQYVEALDFKPENVELTELSRTWRNAGLQRERAFLVARKGGNAVAVAVMETGETGTSLFRLFDNVRLFALQEGGEAAFAELLDEARRWYRSQGKQSFVYLCEEDRALEATKSTLTDLGPGYLWIISSEILPDFLEHVFELTPSRRFG